MQSSSHLLEQTVDEPCKEQRGEVGGGVREKKNQGDCPYDCHRKRGLVDRGVEERRGGY